MPKAKIQGKENTIAKIFSDDYVFSIPNYQRPYAWTKENASALIEDLLDSIEEGKDIESLDPYFLGSIVLIKKEDKPESEIIDGQQRLVTLTILFAAIRYLVTGKESKEMSEFIYEKGSGVRGTSDRFRLTVRRKDDDFFKRYIQSEGSEEDLINVKATSDSCENMKQNFLLFVSRLEELSEEKRYFLAQYIARNCYLVVVSTPNFDSAYRIFSVLNDRGQELQLTDILKSEIIGKIHEIDEDREDEYTQKWEDLEDQLGRDSFAQLFAHIRMIYAQRKLRKTVLEEIRDFVKPTAAPEYFIDNKLIPLGESFDKVKNENIDETSHDEEINRYLVYLNRIDNFDWIPPLIYYITHYKPNDDDLLCFVKKLERLASCLMIIRADINYRIERFGKLLKLIDEKKYLFNDDSPIELSSHEQNNAIETLNGDIYNIVKIRLPVLLRLDEYLSSGSASYNYKIVSVEHVLPQNPPKDSLWLQWWPDEEQRNLYVHTLGNLVLLSRKKNSQAKNYDFDKKKNSYFTKKGVSPFAITSQVLQKNSWTPDVVEERQSFLLLMLKEIWNLKYTPMRRTN